MVKIYKQRARPVGNFSQLSSVLSVSICVLTLLIVTGLAIWHTRNTASIVSKGFYLRIIKKIKRHKQVWSGVKNQVIQVYLENMILVKLIDLYSILSQFISKALRYRTC